MDESIDEIKQQNKKTKNRLYNLFLVFSLIIIFIYFFLSAPFENKNQIIHISNGQSISSISLDLKNKNVIRNSFVLKVFIKLLKTGNGVVSGDYFISKNSPVYIIAWQLARGHHNVESIKVTIREGLNNEQIAILLESKLAGFKKDIFLSSVKDKQGYLFPDTYFFFPLDTTKEIIDKLSDNFEIKIKNIKLSIEKKGKSLSDIVIMASILEGEASGREDIKIISGILWKRISLGMPLQVDVDKSTYNIKGLPLEPLNNPGLVSIEASISPESSKYLYYLHDKDGKVHYAVTFDEHKRNISKYLK
jgi:UPF0755 protein